MPLFTILTPTWNRVSYIERLWNGLMSQTNKDFEWIVSDDGSTDGTSELVRSLAKKSDFAVTLIQASVHIGKARMDNEAIRRAAGELVLWNDSDDYFLPDAIENIAAAWLSIPTAERDDFVGVTALYRTHNGILSTPLPASGCFDMSWNDLRLKHKVRGDMQYVVRTSALKNAPFPEVDFVIPESVLWIAMGNRKTRVIPDIVKMVEYSAPNRISFSGLMEFNRGRALSMATSEAEVRKHDPSTKARMWRLVTFLRYGIHGEISFRDQMNLWGGNSPTMLLLAVWPLAFMWACRDSLLGKVRRTHREFVEADKVVSISVETLYEPAAAGVK